MPAISEVCQQAVQESYSYEQFLLELLRLESEGRQQRRIERLLRESHLPLEKILEAFDLARLPAKVRQQVTALRDGAFVERRENVLAFGKPGSGKTHLLCACVRSWCNRGDGRYTPPAPCWCRSY